MNGPPVRPIPVGPIIGSQAVCPNPPLKAKVTNADVLQILSFNPQKGPW